MVEAELLLDLAGHRLLRRLVDLDDAAGQVPVGLVGELAEQHPAVAVAHQHLPDRALAGEEGVEQRPEALRLVQRGVGREPRVDDPVDRGAVDGHAAHHALAPQSRPGRGPLGALVVGVDQRLDPGVVDERGDHVVADDVDRLVGVQVIRAMPSATVVTEVVWLGHESQRSGHD